MLIFRDLGNDMLIDESWEGDLRGLFITFMIDISPPSNGP